MFCDGCGMVDDGCGMVDVMTCFMMDVEWWM